MTSINKSFIYGVFIASLTWIVSLYLYWKIVETPNTTPNSIRTIENNNHNLFTKASLLNENDDSYKSAKKHQHIKENSVLASSEEHKNMKNNFYDKVNRYKKAKLFRKYNQKLIDELKPIHLDNEKDEFGMVKNAEEQFLKDVGYRQHAFNVLISSKIGLSREIPDTRNSLCTKKIFPTVLPTASIVMCFYNEHLTTLLRSINSVLTRTPEHILNEIILVDDFSDLLDLSEKNFENVLKEHFKDYSKKIHYIKNVKREGLIRSRVYGARSATGDVIIFLDSHIEVNVEWIQPLLSRIKSNKTIVTMPIIDIINADTFSYTSSPLVRGGFNWGLHFKWDNLPAGEIKNPEDITGPFKSPTMAGGLFAIDRNYFLQLGEYDMGMDIWGGENLEISFRIWQCGGSIELLPCSRVGHVFRKRRPYGSPGGGDTMIYNSLRVATVWMDDYQDYFFQQHPHARNLNYGNVTDRINLRKKLKCKPFSWYLKNIYPELEIPGQSNPKIAENRPVYEPWHSRKRNYLKSFMIKLTNTSYCITVDSTTDKGFWKKGSLLKLGSCLRTKKTLWYQTDKSELVLGQLLCLESPGGLSPPILNKCHEMGGDQEWKFKIKNNVPIYNMATGTCLSAKDMNKNSIIQMKICSTSPLSTWDII